HVFLLNLKVLNYIYKLDPMLEDRLGSVLEVVSRTQCQKARETANQSNAMTVKHLILPTKEGLKKIAVDEILVLETMQLRRKVEVLTQDDSYEIARTLKDLLEELPCYFMHSHRSIVLNTRRITEIYVKDGYHQAVMASGEKYSISRNYVKNITRAFQQK
ncbi:MAG: LytTR family transcriptional regulator, partial [Clostridia bacterium]|nr:LytTR family transcriptional regulator [Clostridia bacterium]